jgi:hypothetical protein
LNFHRLYNYLAKSEGGQGSFIPKNQKNAAYSKECRFARMNAEKHSGMDRIRKACVGLRPIGSFSSVSEEEGGSALSDGG